MGPEWRQRYLLISKNSLESREKVPKEDLLQHPFYIGPVPELRIAAACFKERTFETC